MKVRSFLTFLPIVVLIISTLPLILPYFSQGFFPTHDGEWAVVRLADMYREVRDGQIPARFSGNLNFSYGYPLFHFAYPLPYYLGLPFYLIDFGLVNSIKLLFAMSVPVSAVLMYYLSKKMWGTTIGAVISALLYAYLPYRVVDLYVRGSLGESLASIFFPLILLCILELQKRSSAFYSLLLSVSFGALILTHNIMAILFSIVIGTFLVTIFFSKDKKRLKEILISLVLGIGFSAFFWLPAIGEKSYIFLSQIPIANRDLYYVSLQQLLIPSWGYGTPTDSDPFTYQIGVVHVLFFITTVFFFLKEYSKRKKVVKEKGVLLVLIFTFIFLLFPFAKVIWENVPLLSEINYPWTLLFPIGFLISLLAGSLKPSGKIVYGVVVLLLFIVIGTVSQYAKPSEVVDRGDGYYFTNDATTTSSQELMPLWVKELPSSRPEKKIEVLGKGEVTILENRSHKIVFQANLKEASIIRLNTIYFPGWEWTKNGNPLAIRYDNPKGVMEVQLSKGVHSVEVYLRNTPIRVIANIVTIVSILFMIMYFFITLKYTKKTHE